jgi:hypothetical protein
MNENGDLREGFLADVARDAVGRVEAFEDKVLRRLLAASGADRIKRNTS